MPEFDGTLCILCGDCIPSCPNGALSISAGALVLDDEKCAYCGDCEDVCPMNAISLPFEIVLAQSDDPMGG